MIYRRYKGIGTNVSQLGFGCMRYPHNEDGTINKLKTVRLLREAYRKGVNYYDTAYVYNGGKSEEILGHAVKPFRDDVIISTKNPVRMDDTRKTWRERLDQSVERLGGPPDILNFHFLSWDVFRKKCAPKRKGMLAEARKAQEEGLFGHLAISSHDDTKGMIKLLDTDEFVGITLQYNLLDRVNEPVIDHAYKKGIAVVVMGPVGGGRLAAPSDKLRRLIRRRVRSTPEIALRFVLANRHVTCAISGMNERKQLTENLRTANMKKPLSATEKRKVSAALDEIRELSNLYCTGCGYCMPCPHGVNIPRNFSLMNMYRVWGLKDYARARYARLVNKDRGGLQAGKCKKCGRCVPLCPQHIDIIAQLQETHAALGG